MWTNQGFHSTQAGRLPTSASPAVERSSSSCRRGWLTSFLGKKRDGTANPSRRAAASASPIGAAVDQGYPQTKVTGSLQSLNLFLANARAWNMYVVPVARPVIVAGCLTPVNGKLVHASGAAPFRTGP
jgi:hypothetical protein